MRTSEQIKVFLFSLTFSLLNESLFLSFTGNGFIEGTELDGFLREFVSSANPTEVNAEVSYCCEAFIL